ncbi:MAG: beta-glucosidase [Oscillospiraceae bacterium]|nr:beta-glucosidase [Oscillospiraceae bacterium]
MAQFPKEFLWGAASASYQIEGGVQEGGRGESIWDVFSHTPGKVKHGDTGDVAADSYHRWREDIALLKEMGLGAYRFSIAWPRIAPKGGTDWNQAGLDYYSELVDALLEAGIEPWVTLYHWDLPQALQAKGGWQNQETVRAYAAYAVKVGEALKSCVKRWFTFNEPQCFINLGCASGEHAPGLHLDDDALAVCWENFHRAHSLAADALHEIDSENLVGIASTGTVCYPATDSAKDVEAARQLTFALPQGVRTFSHTLALDPLCLEERYTKPDFIGINLYNGTAVRMGENGPEEVPYPTGGPRTAIGWPITPEALEWGPRFLAERYKLPIYISENGLSCNDKIFLDGQVHDPQRVDFLARYLESLSRAVADGVNIRGYFHWSLTDNFEWAEGYDQRFGLAYVDYASGKRILKDSGRWYSSIAGSNGHILF